MRLCAKYIFLLCFALAITALVGKCLSRGATGATNPTGLENDFVLNICVATHNDKPVIFLADACITTNGFKAILKGRQKRGLAPPMRLQCDSGIDTKAILDMLDQAISCGFTNITIILQQDLHEDLCRALKEDQPKLIY